MRISARTWVFFVGALLMSVAAYISVTFGLVGGSVQVAIADLGEPLVLSLCALMCLWVASRCERGEPLNRQWTLIGLGLLFFALGDLVWAVYEIVVGAEPPSPGLIDVCYVLFYPLVGLGILNAAWGYRRLVSLRGPALGATAVGLVLAGSMWVLFLGNVAEELGNNPAATALSLFYPLAAIAFVVVPTTLVLLVVLRMHGGRLAIPWLPVALGGLLFAASDTWFLYMQWAGSYEGGHPLDAGWMIGGTLVALGASLAADVNRLGGQPARVRTRAAVATQTVDAPAPSHTPTAPTL